MLNIDKSKWVSKEYTDTINSKFEEIEAELKGLFQEYQDYTGEKSFKCFLEDSFEYGIDSLAPSYKLCKDYTLIGCSGYWFIYHIPSGRNKRIVCV
jgi:hypothetical protein